MARMAVAERVPRVKSVRSDVRPVRPVSVPARESGTSNAIQLRLVLWSVLRAQPGRKLEWASALRRVRELYEGNVNQLFFVNAVVFDPGERFDVFNSGGTRIVRLR